MSGEICALGRRFCWAMSSTLTKSLTGKFQPVNLNLLRCLAASIFFWMIIPFYPGTKALTQTPLTPLLYLILSAVIGIAVGGHPLLQRSDVDRCHPGVSPGSICHAPHDFGRSRPILRGTHYLVVGPGYSFSSRRNLPDHYPQGKTRLLLKGRIFEKREVGISLILLAASLWTIAISLLKVGLQRVNLILANGIRLPPC